MATTWWSTPTGAVVELGDGEGFPDNSWTELTQAHYNAEVAAIGSAAVQRAAEEQGSDCAARKAVYTNLKASRHTDDWTEATIEAVAGWKPGDC